MKEKATIFVKVNGIKKGLDSRPARSNGQWKDLKGIDQNHGQNNARPALHSLEEQRKEATKIIRY